MKAVIIVIHDIHGGCYTQTYSPHTRQQVWSDVVRVKEVASWELVKMSVSRTLAKYGKLDMG